MSWRSRLLGAIPEERRGALYDLAAIGTLAYLLYLGIGLLAAVVAGAIGFTNHLQSSLPEPLFPLLLVAIFLIFAGLIPFVLMLLRGPTPRTTLPHISAPGAELRPPAPSNESDERLDYLRALVRSRLADYPLTEGDREAIVCGLSRAVDSPAMRFPFESGLDAVDIKDTGQRRNNDQVWQIQLTDCKAHGGGLIRSDGTASTLHSLHRKLRDLSEESWGHYRPVQAPQALSIITAKYGAEPTWADVHEFVARRNVGGRIEMDVTNDSLGGDPVPNVPKVLKVTYAVGTSSPATFEVAEGDHVSIP